MWVERLHGAVAIKIIGGFRPKADFRSAGTAARVRLSPILGVYSRNVSRLGHQSYVVQRATMFRRAETPRIMCMARDYGDSIMELVKHSANTWGSPQCILRPWAEEGCGSK